jgi:hypothetical protein
MKRKSLRSARPSREVRLVKLANILQRGRPVTRLELEEELGVARATLTRDIALLRDQLNMPIAFDRELEGYVLASSREYNGPRYELPGIWLSGAQAYGLLTLTNVVMTIDPGVLSKALEPLRSMMKQILSLDIDRPPPVHDKLAIEIAYDDVGDSEVFGLLSGALYSDKRVAIILRDGAQIQGLSLQRYALTREGWFIDTLDNRGEKILRFAVSDIVTVKVSGRCSEHLTINYHQALCSKHGAPLPVERYEIG